MGHSSKTRIFATRALFNIFRGSGAKLSGWKRILLEISLERTYFRKALATVLVWATLKISIPVVFIGVFVDTDGDSFNVIPYVALGVVAAFFTSLRRYLAMHLSRRVERSLLLSVHAHGLRGAQSDLPVSEVVPYSTDPGKTQLFVQLIPIVFGNLLQIVAATVAMLVVAPVLALVTIPPLLVGGFLYALHSRAAAGPTRRARSAHGRMLGLIDEHLTGLEHLNGVGAAGEHASRFHEANTYSARAHLVLAYMRARYMPLADIALSVATISAVLVGGLYTIWGALGVEELLLFYMYTGMLVWPIRNIGMFIIESVPACEAAHRIASLESRQETPAPVDPMPVPQGWVSLIVDTDNIEKHFPSLAEVDGNSPAIFAGTILDNVSMGARAVADAGTVENLCRVVGLADEIAQRPSGYLSDPGSGGAYISGGQRQRLALARALAGGHETLVLRSPLYAVDTSMTSEILERVRILRADKNTVLVTSDTEQVLPGDTVLDLRTPRRWCAKSAEVTALGDPCLESAGLPALSVSFHQGLPADWRKLISWLPRWTPVLLVLGVFASGILVPFLVVLHRWAVDGGILTGRPHTLVLIALLQAGVVLSVWWTTWSHMRIAGKLGEGLLASLRGALFDGVRRGSVNQATSVSGSVLARTTSDAETVRAAVSGNFLPMFSYILLAAGSLTVATVTQGRLVVPALACLPVMLLLSVVFRRLSDVVYPAVARAAGDLMVTAHENLSGCSALHHHDPRSTRVSLFVAKVDEHFAAQMRAVRLTGWYFAGSEILGVFALAGAAFIWQKSGSTPGALFAMVGALALVFEPVQNAVNSYGGVRPGTVALKRLHQLMPTDKVFADSPPTGMVNATADAPVGENRPVYRMEKVSFSFNKEFSPVLVLEYLDLTVSPGERLAIVGASGSGKSTLLKLLASVLSPSSGEVTFVGSSIVPLGTAVLWVPQDAAVFAGTVRYNLSLSPHTVSLEESLESLGLSAEFSGVLDRKISDLSPSQQKMLCFARAAVRKPSVLLLDEPTSGLADAQRSMIINSLDRLGSSTTVVLATHSRSLMGACSRLVTLRGAGPN